MPLSRIVHRTLQSLLLRTAKAAQPTPAGSNVVSTAIKQVVDMVDPETRRMAVAAAAYSDDPAKWAEETRTYMMNSSPERTRAAEAAGDLTFAVQSIAAAGRQAQEAAKREGADAGRALARAKLAMYDQINQPIEGLSRIIARAQAAPPLSFPEFSRIRTWLQYGDFGGEVQDALVKLMTALAQTPALGRLLKHPIFASDRPDGGVLHELLLGACAFGDGRVEEAIVHLGRAYQCRPEPLFAICVANCHRLLGRNPEAMAVVEEALGRWPQDGGLTMLAAGICFAMGDVEKANRLLAPWRESYFARYRDDRNFIDRQAELEEAIAEHRLYRKAEKDIYDDSYAESTWWNYWFHLNAYTRYQHAEAILGELVPHHLTAFLASRPVRPRAVIEVGTMCGELLLRAARHYPDVRFVGVDRNPVIKRLNDRGYREPNMEFRADDILNVLDDRSLPLEGAVLFHTRTSPFLFPDFLRQLYGRCYQKGFAAVCMIEAYPVSIKHQRFQRFEDMPEISEIRGGGLLHHNYPRILKEAGFASVGYEFVRANTLFSGIDSSVFLHATR